MSLALVFILVWAGSALLLDTGNRSRRKSLEVRLRPFQPTLADEVELWLRRQR